MPLYATAGFRVTSAIRRSSSNSCSAVVSSRARRWVQAREFERELQVHERARVAGEPNLASGERMPGLEIPQFEGDDRARSSTGEPEPADGVVLGDVQRE